MGSMLEPLPATNYRKPLGIRFLEHIKKKTLSYKAYQAIVLIVTFFAYASYHATRKTTSVVKSALDPESDVSLKFSPWWRKNLGRPVSWALGSGWAPFDGADGTALLGDIDVAFLGVYAIGMYFSGHLGDRSDVCWFVPINWMALSSCCGRQLVWKEQERTNYGDMECSHFGGEHCSPESVGAVAEEDQVHSPRKNGEEVTEPLLQSDTEVKKKAIGFIEAWKIPGVAPFALCLFFAKLVAYTFLYWLPFYISHTDIDGKYLSSEAAGNLSTVFDVGGVVGGILAGHISDRLGARAITAASFMYCAIPALFFYRSYGSISVPVNVVLMFITGLFVNGPYALITTAVSADLGTHSSLEGDSRALATVTAIIDGTGSVGAALGPLLTGYISAKSWSAVFTMLMASALVAGLLLTRLVVAEVAAKIAESRRQGGPTSRSPVPLEV
ncbi:putative glycerol-3-phosphate transporter 1 [Vitis vinifera]|uniref:Putative glycerol-3-phosphate transporter 1 n=1 Tax=Vitis vinifera TaxID=29760 RepID=A0A438CMB8_VITVI|nr:putative glycerol-3-phosphate transporter 1 [Vitis vinifera]